MFTLTPVKGTKQKASTIFDLWWTQFNNIPFLVEIIAIFWYFYWLSILVFDCPLSYFYYNVSQWLFINLEILRTESPVALTGSASGLKRLRRWATAYIIFHQIVGAVDRSRYPWIQGEWLHYNTPPPVKFLPLFLGVPSSRTGVFMVWWFDFMWGNTQKLNRKRFSLKKSEEEVIG